MLMPLIPSTNPFDDPPDLALGAADQPSERDTAAADADGVSTVDVDRPAERYLSNRVLADDDQNLFSENGVTHWGFVWGQFTDHTISLRDGGDGIEEIALVFDVGEPLEEFTSNNEGTLLTVDGYLPTLLARTDTETPDTDLTGEPGRASAPDDRPRWR